jgi:hypothetical protein
MAQKARPRSSDVDGDRAARIGINKLRKSSNDKMMLILTFFR